jgi:hypothetical protein
MVPSRKQQITTDAQGCAPIGVQDKLLTSRSYSGPISVELMIRFLDDPAHELLESGSC